MTSVPSDLPAAPPRAGRRSLARLAAVQALYQIELTGIPAGNVIAEFAAHRFGKEIDGEHYGDADRRFFSELVGGSSEHGAELDRMISAALPVDWPLERLDRVLRAILRIGAFELYCRSDVPVRVVINEYLEIAHAFFAGKEPGMINAVLDRIGQVLRPSELGVSDRDGGT